MKKISRLEMAKVLASYAHDGQVDKSGVPYINHPLAVAEKFDDEDLKIIALLHDVVEDTFVSINTIDNLFGFKISNAVEALTRRDLEDYESYIRRLALNELAIRVKLADLSHNMQLDRLVKISPKDIERQKKYQDAKVFLEKKLEVNNEE